MKSSWRGAGSIAGPFTFVGSAGIGPSMEASTGLGLGSRTSMRLGRLGDGEVGHNRPTSYQGIPSGKLT